MKDHIKIQTLNPYFSRYPDKKVISRETLELVKELRELGFKISFLPEDKRKLCFIFKNGVQDFITEPIFIFAASSIWSIIVGVLSNRIDHRFFNRAKRKRVLKSSKSKIIIKDEATNSYYSLEGKKVSVLKKKKLEEEHIKVITDFHLSDTASPPKLNLRYPIYLEHGYNRVVGWGDIRKMKNKLVMKDCIFILDSIEEKIKKGEIKGASIGGIAEKSTCSICNKNYVECNHISGIEYNGETCVCTISKSLIADISLVKDPINQECLFDILEILGKHKE